MQCNREKILRPNYFSKYINIKEVFANHYKLDRPVGMAKMLELAKLSLEGHHHSGIDDCKNISRIVEHLLKQGVSLGKDVVKTVGKKS
jgi:inhibitor of KinA sporulation pathway (predicted exonuclease)